MRNVPLVRTKRVDCEMFQIGAMFSNAGEEVVEHAFITGCWGEDQHPKVGEGLDG